MCKILNYFYYLNELLKYIIEYNKLDNDIMIIPDIEEEEKNEMLTTVAAPPQIKVNRIPTMRELENEFFNSSEERLNEVIFFK